MKNDFWKNLTRPIIALAPMAGITDGAFRRICEEFGADVVYTEMANVRALSYQPRKTLDMLKGKPDRIPLVVQLFGSEPEYFRRAIKLVEKEIAPDGIDINFGCPAPKVTKTKAGAELFQDPDLSREVIQASLEASNLPISIKVRIQVGQVGFFDFWDKIKDLDIKAIMIHGRSFSQGFSGEIDCRTIANIKQEFSGAVLANGGIYDRREAERILRETEADGVGLARGVMGNPWLFSEIKESREAEKTREYIFYTARKQAELAQDLKGSRGIIEMRKHLCWYVQGLPGAKDIRRQLVEVETLEDIKKILKP